MRFIEGKDVWVCSCGAVVAIGRVCGCGKTYADILGAKHARKPDTERRKFRQPAGRGEFTESYCIKTGK